MSGPLRLASAVVANEPAGDYRVMTLSAPEVPRRFRPGQFVALAVGGRQSALLGRRAFSVYEAVPGDTAAGDLVRIVVGVHGPGTAWLAGLGAGAPVDLLGPLGQPFRLPPAGSRCVLVGGGYGSAPLFALADALRDRGCEVRLVLGAATAARLFGVDQAAARGLALTVTTEDGSSGQPGMVTDVLPPSLCSARPAGPVFACGPMPMLRAVSAQAHASGADTQVAVEEAMACGIGVCMTCVLPVVGADGKTRMTRSCVEGPVFSGQAVRWRDIGTVPDDAVGSGSTQGPQTAQTAQTTGTAR